MTTAHTRWKRSWSVCTSETELLPPTAKLGTDKILQWTNVSKYLHKQSVWFVGCMGSNLRITWQWGALAQPPLQWKRSITYFKCVSVALAIPQVMCMSHVILSFVAYMAPQCVCTVYQKRHDFRKKSYWIRSVFFFLQLLSETILIIIKSEWDTNTDVHRSSRKVPTTLVIF